MKIRILAMVLSIFCLLLVSCGPKKIKGRPEPVPRPDWTDRQARAAVEKMAEEYRANPGEFWEQRTCVWSGTWIWPETIGINESHMPLLKQMFEEGDDAQREIVLNVILMNIPPDKLKNEHSGFMRELVLLDTELKESRANVPPPKPEIDIIIDEGE